MDDQDVSGQCCVSIIMSDREQPGPSGVGSSASTLSEEWEQGEEQAVGCGPVGREMVCQPVGVHSRTDCVASSAHVRAFVPRVNWREVGLRLYV